MSRNAIVAALGQREVELEVIVVDEGSSDQTRAELARIDDDRLIVIRHDAPKGVAAARNAAIALARGEWIGFLDDDDLWAPEKLHTQLMRADTAAHSLCYSGTVHIDQRNRVLRYAAPPDPRDLDRAVFASNALGTPSSVIVRANVLERTGGFDERLSALADWDLWIRTLPAATPGASPEPLVAYRRHAESMMNANASALMAEFEMLRAKHRAEAEKRGLEFGRPWLLHWRAGRDLAAGRRVRASTGYLRCALADRNPRHLAPALGALGGRLERLGRSRRSRLASRPEWLDRYA
jgi:glycosyltransferase involved in cell wall biosynthesis